MKQYIVSLLFLGLGAVATAQVSGAPTASSDTALPGVAVTANVGTSIQTGINNKVEVAQAGTKQSALTNQNDSDNQARIYQSGSLSSVSGELNVAQINQDDDDNSADISQGGDANNAIINQDNAMNAAGVNGNTATIQQGIINAAEGNFAAIDQNGAENSAMVLQAFDNNDSYITQKGKANTSDVTQLGGPFSSLGQESFVDQRGNENEAKVIQAKWLFGSPGRNTAKAIQVGDSNFGQQTQVVIGGQGNDASINQGETNVATSAAVSTVADLVAGYIDNGPENTGSQGGIAFQEQFGGSNTAQISQFGSSVQANNYADQTQRGFSNNAIIVQNFNGNSNGGGNTTIQFQEGTSNETIAVQRGIDNGIDLFQDANNNTAYSAQRARNNMADINQFGDQNVGYTAQRGNNNVIIATQYNGQSFTVKQRGDNNQADIFQQGPSDTFSQGTFSIGAGQTPIAVNGAARLNLVSIGNN